MKRSGLLLRPLLILISLFIISCGSSYPTKTVNSFYEGKSFKGRTVAIVLLDSLTNLSDKNTNDYLTKNYGSFGSLFSNYFPQYLAEYSRAIGPCFIHGEKKYFNDLLTFRNIKTLEFIVAPSKGTIVKDPNYDNFDVVLVLYKTTLRAFNGHVYKGDQGYSGQNGGRDGYITMNGRMLLWDNIIGDAITYGAFSATRFIPALAELTKRDFEDCLRLLSADITAESPLFDENKTAGLKKLR